MFEENYNSTPASKEQLLRFLEAGRRLAGKPDSEEDFALASPTLARSADCPALESYIDLATGAAIGEEADELLAHASVCASCASTLSRSLSALEGNPSEEETAAIAELASAHMDWQRQKARELAATPARKRPRLEHPLFQDFGRWVPGAAVAAGLVLAVGFWYSQRAAHAPEYQLAMAYQESRTLELRVPHAGYAALAADRRTRGASGDDESPSLLDARARLRRELEHAPQDSRWLQLQARADILEERYDQAIDVLDRLRAQGPVTAELLGDLAMAYYQRGLVSGGEGDRSTALDYLRQADQLAPTEPVILFNEAIVMEDRGQMMNAVEVWTRYITLERDALWKAEGQRKLSALEQTLNRLKSHESRIREMLATPAAMDAIAADRPKLALVDEELSSYSLGKLLLAAFPEDNASAKEKERGTQESRGSPCAATCMAARRLLQAVGNSLVLEHHDFWLTDLFNPFNASNLDGRSAKSEEAFEAGLRLLGQAVNDDLNGAPIEASRKSLDAGKLFELAATGDARWRVAVHVAKRRAAVEYLYALQRNISFPQCQEAAARLRSQPGNARDQARYPWLAAQALITEEVCDQTPETRSAGRVLGRQASEIAEDEHYRLMKARVNAMISAEEIDSGDVEAAERLLLPTLKDLYAGDSPAFRIFNTIGSVAFTERRSPRSYSDEMYFRESLGWAQLNGSLFQIASSREELACAEIRNGESTDAAGQLRLADSEFKTEEQATGEKTNLTEESARVADAMLASGNLNGALRYLDRGAKDEAKTGDWYLIGKYAMARGQLELSLGHADRSVAILEKAIRMSEGAKVSHADQATSAEFGESDHDAYAELVAAWLAEGRKPESALALWERFRLRSRGLPITQCAGDALDCELPHLVAEEHNLGDNILLGQVVLLDRVLIYRSDRNGVTWSTKPLHRQDFLKAAQSFEHAVSSSVTSTETASQLGEKLTGELLPDLPVAHGFQGTLFLEPDPMVENLSWPVLPTPNGPLGLTYPVAELQSILAPARPADRHADGDTQMALGTGALVVGASITTNTEPPLPEALSEAEDVRRILHARGLLAGNQATAPRVAQALGSATLFHFAGHAVQTAQGTELLLAPALPGDPAPWVDGNFLRQHPPKACRLAVLSACGTGEREASWNHPLQDIVQTLGKLGVPEVVATRWQIDSSTAVPFMDAFYSNLSNGKSVALALMLARRVQSAQPTSKNPYYWGAYYVAGRETSYPTGELHAHLEKDHQGQKVRR